jgi:hypothetical protein
MDRKKLIRLIVAPVIIIVVLALVIAFFLTRPEKITLSQTAKVTAVPTFIRPTGKLDGFNLAISGLTSPTQAYYSSKYNMKKSVTYLGSGSTKKCSVSAQVYYSDASLAKLGDRYATYDFLNSIGATRNVILGKTSYTNVSATPNQALQFVTTEITYKALSSKTVTSTYNERIAVRALGKVYDNQLTGTEKAKGIPVLVIDYQCVNSKTDAATFTKALNEMKVKLS